MFGATTNYPYNFANRNGIPMIESNNVTVSDTNVVIGIPNRAFRFLSGTGLILFRLNTEITNTTLPILFSSVGGDSATGEQLGGAGIYLIYYAKDCNLLQLITLAPSTGE